eukprot:CAMPEP_0174696150 /NCGR_PEP_ID=MMETSP1094-20130205/2377_1 /TAXON_ID=156173 /ORGANISM="Chrysochromulina brevifilum, Strain UTEX LB 985" /LENGTH=56 /DNA_ID=CAMNT_0015892859 /DNA_START=119 /DNA_END=286 /DNA_ORIENTATION=-
MVEGVEGAEVSRREDGGMRTVAAEPAEDQEVVAVSACRSSSSSSLLRSTISAPLFP